MINEINKMSNGVKKYNINKFGFTPHLLVRDRLNYSPSNRKGVSRGSPLTFLEKKGEGFTAIELLVSTTILIVIFSFVLANFRAGQYGGELDVITRQIIDGVSTVRIMTLGGQVTPAGIFPAGGYGVSFDTNTNNRNRFVLFADLGPTPSGSYDSGEEIPNGIVQFLNVDLIDLCVSSEAKVESLPCLSPWSSIISNRLDIIFPVPGRVVASDGSSALDNQFVGGVLEHQKTGRQSYFYVSLFSGLITGDEL